eukprot:COSAG02_NODE_2121_length_9774_cov_3.757003_7_plen_125_part_00
MGDYRAPPRSGKSGQVPNSNPTLLKRTTRTVAVHHASVRIHCMYVDCAVHAGILYELESVDCTINRSSIVEYRYSRYYCTCTRGAVRPPASAIIFLPALRDVGNDAIVVGMIVHYCKLVQFVPL